MALSGTVVTQDFQGDDATTDFAIPFYFVSAEQVRVSIVTDEGTDDEVVTELVNGIGFTVTGTDPGTTVVMTTAPASDEVVRVYRQTEKNQPYDFINAGKFLSENVEAALDRLLMIIQELGESIGLTASGSLSNNSAYVRLGNQTVSASGTITIDTSQRLLKSVQGNSAAVIVDTTTGIDNGVSDLQELVMVGLSDTNTVTLTNSGNVRLTGNFTLYQNSLLHLIWDANNLKWLELARST